MSDVNKTKLLEKIRTLGLTQQESFFIEHLLEPYVLKEKIQKYLKDNDFDENDVIEIDFLNRIELKAVNDLIEENVSKEKITEVLKAMSSSECSLYDKRFACYYEDVVYDYITEDVEEWLEKHKTEEKEQMVKNYIVEMGLGYLDTNRWFIVFDN